MFPIHRWNAVGLESSMMRLIPGLGQPCLALFRWDGWQCASVGDGKRRQSGDRERHLWSWYYHVELGQLCRVMRDVPSDERLCYMLHVVAY